MTNWLISAGVIVQSEREPYAAFNGQQGQVTRIVSRTAEDTRFNVLVGQCMLENMALSDFRFLKEQ